MKKIEKNLTMTANRICSRCGEEKPLNKDNYQVVTYFAKGFSYYCNECNKPKPRD
jgi:hypothetical protein